MLHTEFNETVWNVSRFPRKDEKEFFSNPIVAFMQPNKWVAKVMDKTQFREYDLMSVREIMPYWNVQLLRNLRKS